VSVETLLVREVIHATPRTRILRLDVGRSAFAFEAGQAVMAGLHGSPLRKPYSIATAPSEAAGTGIIELLVQVDDTGGPDPHLDLAAPGVALDVEGPFGAFGRALASAGAPLLLIGGGTGIAPLRSILIEALAVNPGRRVSVIYSARSPRELAYRAELEALAAASGVSLHLTVTRDEGEAWRGRRGRIDEALLREALPGSNALCLVCGPPSLVRDTVECLRLVGVAEPAIIVERYDG
jgi:NAD(P)H-flavin reductase